MKTHWKISGWWLIPILLYTTAVSFFHYGKDPLPLMDRGHLILATEDEKKWMDTISMFKHFRREPRFWIRDDLADQCVFWDNVVVLNQKDRAAYAKLGKPSAGISFVVDDPELAAKTAKLAMAKLGHKGEILTGLDPQTPKGSLVFFRCDAFNGWVVVFRKHITQMGPIPPAFPGSGDPMGSDVFAKILGVSALIFLVVRLLGHTLWRRAQKR